MISQVYAKVLTECLLEHLNYNYYRTPSPEGEKERNPKVRLEIQPVSSRYGELLP